MKNPVFSVYDSKAGTYSVPTPMISKGVAIRSFAASAADPNHTFGKHPEDYTLFELGTFDDETGKFENAHTPLSLGVALEFKK